MFNILNLSINHFSEQTTSGNAGYVTQDLKGVI